MKTQMCAVLLAVALMASILPPVTIAQNETNCTNCGQNQQLREDVNASVSPLTYKDYSLIHTSLEATALQARAVSLDLSQAQKYLFGDSGVTFYLIPLETPAARALNESPDADASYRVKGNSRDPGRGINQKKIRRPPKQPALPDRPSGIQFLFFFEKAEESVGFVTELTPLSDSTIQLSFSDASSSNVAKLVYENEVLKKVELIGDLPTAESLAPPGNGKSAIRAQGLRLPDFWGLVLCLLFRGVYNRVNASPFCASCLLYLARLYRDPSAAAGARLFCSSCLVTMGQGFSECWRRAGGST